MKDKEGGLPERQQEGTAAARMCEYEGDGIGRWDLEMGHKQGVEVIH